jgi:hypothetical protein
MFSPVFTKNGLFLAFPHNYMQMLNTGIISIVRGGQITAQAPHPTHLAESTKGYDIMLLRLNSIVMAL